MLIDITPLGRHRYFRLLLAEVFWLAGAPIAAAPCYRCASAFIAAHHLHPVIDPVLPLAQFDTARKYMEAGNFISKVVLRVYTTR